MLSNPKITQFEIVIAFSVKKFIYYGNEREARIIIFATTNRYCSYKIVKSGSCTGHLLLFLGNFVSYLQSMKFVTLEMLLDSTV